MGVEFGVEGRVVVHFELVVDAEGALAGENLVDEGLETFFEVVELLGDEGEALGAFLYMGEVDVGAEGFFLDVVLFKDHDGEAVDDHARGFGVEGAGGGRRGCEVVDKLVDAFHVIVTFLVMFIDGAFGVVDVFEAHVVAAGAVFFVPEAKIMQVIGFDEAW